MRLVDWYLALNLGQKVVVGMVALLSVFVFGYLASLIIIVVAGGGQGEGARPPQGQEGGGTPTPASLAAQGASAGASSAPDSALLKKEKNFELRIRGARWEGERAVVEGTWQGDLSSVHCDLLEGGEAGHAIDWWDRSVPARMSFAKRTFSQEFVRAKGRVKDRIDPKGDYWASCWAQFSYGAATGDEAPVAGKPPAGGGG